MVAMCVRTVVGAIWSVSICQAFRKPFGDEPLSFRELIQRVELPGSRIEHEMPPFIGY